MLFQTDIKDRIMFYFSSTLCEILFSTDSCNFSNISIQKFSAQNHKGKRLIKCKVMFMFDSRKPSLRLTQNIFHVCHSPIKNNWFQNCFWLQQNLAEKIFSRKILATSLQYQLFKRKNNISKLKSTKVFTNKKSLNIMTKYY